MRIRQLDLLRYGHFTDASIALTTCTPDIHIVLGENEAGKSTAMAGIEDLLFGIPSNSTRNFLHEYSAMRIGATLEKTADTLKLRRRKGNKDTLLSEQDIPFPSAEGALAPYLGGADRSFYARMFSLDHERLRQGGKEILEAKDDVGQTLFAASAGIVGLREALKTMEMEADTLWASRRAARRKYSQAEDRLKDAEASMRDHIVTTAKWQLSKAALETANTAYRAIEQEIEDRSAGLCKLSRIRRVSRDVRKRAETEAALHALGNVIPFSEDALGVLENATKDDDAAASRIAILNEQITALEAERTALTCDQALLLRADDIQQLHDRRIQIRACKTDLPKRRVELTGAVTALTRLAAELEWTGDVDQLMARIPPKAKIATLRSLLNRRGEQVAAIENAKGALDEANGTLTELVAQTEALGSVTDVSSLAAVIKATREMGDVGGQIANSKRKAQEVRAKIDFALKSLRPAIADHDDMASMIVPLLDSVEAHRDACRNLEQRAIACAERVRAAKQELDRHRKAYNRIASSEQVVAPEEMQRLRNHRDNGWSIIRRRYVHGVAVPDDEILAFSAVVEIPQAFEAAMHEVDNAADRRFDKSEAAASLAVLARQISEKGELLESLTTEEKGLAEERGALDAAWASMWAATPVSPLDPDLMIQWLRGRSDLVRLISELSAAQWELAGWQDREADAKRLVQSELDALGLPSAHLASQPLHVVIESAAAVERTHEGTAKTRRDLEESQRQAASDILRKRKTFEKAELGWNNWTTQWEEALQALQLPSSSTPETADEQINAIDDMREAVGRINDLRHERIEKIERDIRAFEQDVGALVETIAPQLAGIDAEDAVLALEQLAAEAKRVRDLTLAKDAALIGLQEKVNACHESARDARNVIGRFQDAAGVETINALRIAIRQSDEVRTLQSEFDRLTNSLVHDGDGLSTAALSEECAATDPDQITAREQTVKREVNELRDQLMEARETRSNARREFGTIGGDDRAARDAADRQAALAEIKEIAEQYVRLRSAIVLLRWSIDRYRREKQAPMLKRAGELFAILTGDSFQMLQLEFDENDNVELAGVRQDGKHVPVAGMSDGTVDQLYLALRIAAIEDYLNHGEPMPFIADDLFINSADKRAAAGFQVLNELGKKTQVLFFTHHEHLADVARRTLGASTSTITLPPIAHNSIQDAVRSAAA